MPGVVVQKSLLSIALCFLLAASAACGKDANNGSSPDPDPDSGIDMGTDAMTTDDGGDGEDVAVRDTSGEDVSAADTGVDAADVAVDMGPETLTIDEFWERQAAEICDALYECPGVRTSGLTVYAGRHATAEECRQSERTRTILGRLLAPTQTLDDSIADGHVMFDGEAAADCVQKVKSSLCDPTTPPGEADFCRSVFAGTREDGESCRRGECVEGSRCNTGTECFGVCEPVMNPCGGCDEDEYCDTPSGDCKPRGASGAACEGSSQCQKELFCDAPGLGLGTCIPPGSKSSGDVCFTFRACGDGLICKEGVCDNYFVVEEGYACGDLPAVQVCDAGLFCDIPAGDSVGVCAQLQEPGQACENTRACLSPATCSNTTDTCTTPKPFGSACNSAFECESIYCSPAGTCAPWPACELP